MKSLITSLKFLALMTVLTGIVYPVFITLISQLAFNNSANGSLVKNTQGQVIGSELIAQGFKQEKYFWPRPSAVEYNPLPSGGSNLGPTSQDLVAKVKERKEKGLTGDLLFASASGLDPHISPKDAKSQVARVAKARGMSETDILDMVSSQTENRQLGFLGEKRVNVLRLNIALDERTK